MNKKKQLNKVSRAVNLESKEYLDRFNEPNFKKSALKTVGLIIIFIAIFFFLIYMALATSNWAIS